MTKKINIIGIAEQTGFSTTTVSRVLNGYAQKYRISEETEKSIKSIAEKLNYKPSIIAQSLRLKRTNTIGLIIPDIANPFFAGIAKIIIRKAQLNNYSVILTDSEEDNDLEKKLLDLLISRRVDGLIVLPCGKDSKHLARAKAQGLPIVQVDRYFEDIDVPYISTDNYTGAYDATKILLEKGHHKIACIQGLKYAAPNQKRVAGFVDAMKEASIKDYSVVGEDFSIENGYNQAKLLFAKPQNQRPTAIFALSNLIALGVIEAAKELDVKIPQDVSLITFDNQVFLEYLNPSISSVAQPIDEISDVALNMLIKQIDDASLTADDSVLLKPQIMLRESVKEII